jgi:hypothetical protein
VSNYLQVWPKDKTFFETSGIVIAVLAQYQKNTRIFTQNREIEICQNDDNKTPKDGSTANS